MICPHCKEIDAFYIDSDNPFNFKCLKCGHIQVRDDEHWFVWKRDSGEPYYDGIYECRLCGDEYHVSNDDTNQLPDLGCRCNGYGSELSYWKTSS